MISKENLPDSWELINLVSDINYISTGVNTYNDVKYYYSTGSIKSHAVLPEGKYTYQDRPSRANRFVNKGDVLQARMKATNKPLLIDDKFDLQLFSTGFFHLRSFDDSISSKYLYYFISSSVFLDEKDKLCSGSTQEALNDNAAKNLYIPLPPINEQNRIVEKIEELTSELDKGIESLKIAREQLKVYREALLKHAFEGKLTEQWRNENADRLETANELLVRIQKDREVFYKQQLNDWELEVLKRNKETKKVKKPRIENTYIEISEKEIASFPILPNEWKWVRVINLLDRKPSNGRSVPDRVGGFKVLRLTSLKSKYVNADENKEGAWARNEAERYLIKKGDFLISRGNGSIRLVGRGAIVDRDYDIAYPDTIVKLSIAEKIYNMELFSYFWGSNIFRRQIEGSARTTAGIYKINQALISNYKFPLIPLDEQCLINEILDQKLSVIDETEKEVVGNLLKSKALRQSILKKAFSGKLVPQDPNDEPASELLKRIAKAKAEIEAQLKAKKASKKKTKKKTTTTKKKTSKKVKKV